MVSCLRTAAFNRALVAVAAVALMVVCLGVDRTGAVWPEPVQFTFGTETVQVVPALFEVVTNSSSEVLQSAIQRYNFQLFFPFEYQVNLEEAAGQHVRREAAPPATQSLVLLVVNVGSDSEDLFLGVSENYTLDIFYNNSVPVAVIEAPTVFGAIRALETFSQLIEYNTSTVAGYYIQHIPISILDYPRFPWRGLLIDTARHYLPVPVILRQIDAMSYTKLNTLHWHVVDAESFPAVINSYPNLSQKGSYAPTAVYNAETIQGIVSYGLSRGVRVVPEFDVPGHSYSWGMGYPELVAVCPYYEANINNIPLDPTKNFTYEVVTAVFTQMTKQFQDSYFHVGGDELVLECWSQDENITQWMEQNNIPNTIALWQYFENHVVEILQSQGRTLVAWEEIFTNGINVPQDTIIEVWEDFTTLQSVVNAGYRALMSSPYYLDKQVPVPNSFQYEWLNTWIEMYQIDPAANITTNANLILGGEACMWGEQVDELSIDERIWPRAAGVAEKFWSPVYVNNVTSATQRLNSFRCSSLARRLIPSSPIMPDYCAIPSVPNPPSPLRK